MTTETIPQAQYLTITPESPAWIPGLEYVLWPEESGIWADGQPKLWARGRLDLLEAAGWGSAVAITGSRAATSYGLHVAGELAFDVAPKASALVATSGFGIDSAALRGAMASDDGLPVAVISCGIDQAYPMAHEDLLRKVQERGVILSLFAPGARVNRAKFEASRVLLAAACQTLVLVESGLRGGGLVAANAASQAGKTVFAVPGPITSCASAGTLALIKEGRAKVCLGADDVLAVLSR